MRLLVGGRRAGRGRESGCPVVKGQGQVEVSLCMRAYGVQEDAVLGLHSIFIYRRYTLGPHCYSVIVPGLCIIQFRMVR